MLVDAAVADDAGDRRYFAEGQELEGEDAELQVGLGHAVAISEPQEAPGEPEAPEVIEESQEPSEAE